MGDHHEYRTIQLLETISSGKQQLTQLMACFFTSNQVNQNHGGSNGNHVGASHIGDRDLEGSNAYVST
jgi:hypothetical protein